MALTTASFLAACGGDDDDTGDDDDDCGGAHNPCEDELSLETPQGGEVFLEYVTADDDLAAALGLTDEKTLARTISFFTNAQTPEALATPDLGPDGCVNIVTSGAWPMGQGEGREYLDVGDLSVTGPSVEGGDQTIDIPLSDDELDVFSRPLDTFYQKVEPHADATMMPNSLYTVDVTGNGDIPAATYEDAIFLADHFELMNPGLEDDVTLTAGEDFTVEWEVIESSNKPADLTQLTAISLVDPSTGQPVIFCVELSSEGSFTIKGDLIQDYRDAVESYGADPNNLVLLRNYVDHRIVKFENGDVDNVRRLDMLGVYCYIQLAATAAAAL